MLVCVCVSCADGCRAPQYGKTPLMLAAEEGQLEVARELISKGADIEAKDDKVRGAEGAIDECCRWRLVESEREERQREACSTQDDGRGWGGSWWRRVCSAF